MTMKKTHILLTVFGAAALFLPLSNLIGLTGKNPVIAPIAGTSANFAAVSTILRSAIVRPSCQPLHCIPSTRFIQA